MKLTFETADDLRETNTHYKRFESLWLEYDHCFKGYKTLAENGYFPQHSRESDNSYKYRLKMGYGPNYSEAIINIFDYYLRTSQLQRKFGPLANDELWQLFQNDVDYYGKDYNIFLEDVRKRASIYGHMGILVDAPRAGAMTRDEAIKNKVYPFYVAYTPLDILDGDEGKDDYGKPILTALKLRERDGTYKIWEINQWRHYGIEKDSENVVLIESGTYDLGAIPFVFEINLPSDYVRIGTSDLKNISGLDLSIYRNIMGVEEVIELAAFPMMRKPMKRAAMTQGGHQSSDYDESGVSAVLEFDPSQGDSAKPDWLKAEVKNPLDAISAWIVWKVGEIYRNATLEDASAETRQAQSGYALTIKRELLNASLETRAKNLSEAEKQCIYFWCKWQQKPELAEDIIINRPKKFSVEELKIDLENAIMSKSIVNSETFSASLQKKISRDSLGENVNDETYETIDKEIDSYVEPVVPVVGDRETEGAYRGVLG
ncbi:MAG: hypothetical protein GY834_08305 [Bacteroidetes bacterium]|nr:hypothetical protein [Bacteroidota bacterium]